MNEWNTLLYKNIISHTLFLKGWWLLCVRDKLETETECYIDHKFFSWPQQHFFLILVWGCSTMGHWGPKALSLQAGSHTSASSLQLTRTVWHLVILLFNARLLSLFFRLFTQVHLLIDGSVEDQYITVFLLCHFAAFLLWLTDSSPSPHFLRLLSFRR